MEEIPLNWLKDMVRSDANDKVSGKKIVFLLTWVVASSVVISMAVKGSLGFEIFTAYLLFGLGADAFSKYIALRSGNSSGNNTGS